MISTSGTEVASGFLGTMSTVRRGAHQQAPSIHSLPAQACMFREKLTMHFRASSS